MKFLTDEWAHALVAAFNDSGSVRNSLADAALTLQQVVTGGPQGDVRYWLTFDHGTITGGLGDATQPPDVTLTQDYETAAALSRGELTAQGAFMQGRLKVTGNMGKLLQHSGAIETLGPVMSSLETEY